MNIPHLDQWMGDWAMEPDRFEASRAALMNLDLHVHMQAGPGLAAAEAKRQSEPNTVGNVEILHLTGSLMKSVPSAVEGTSTVIARRRVRQAAQDPNVSAILLHIDSPGGTVDGTEALAADVAAAAKRKPVYAYIDDLGASAAYWIASQATKVFANATALVGSIGTYAVVHDLSAKAVKDGVKVHVVRAGAMKGQGVPGTEISAELLTMVQERINERNEFFLRGVASGRGLSVERVRELADGRIHLAAKAKDLKLIDGVQSLDATYAQLLAAVSSPKGQSKMDATQSLAVAATAVAIDTASASPGNAPAAPAPAPAPAATPAAPKAATLAELKAACPGAGNDFLVAQLEAGATVQTAIAARMQQLQAENAELRTKAAAPAPAAAAAPEPKKPGASPVPAGAAAAKEGAATGDAIAQWTERMEELTTTGKRTKAAAARELAISEPELHASYIAEYTRANAHKVTRSRETAK